MNTSYGDRIYTVEIMFLLQKKKALRAIHFKERMTGALKPLIPRIKHK